MICISSQHQDKAKNQKDNLDISIERLFNEQEARLSVTNGREETSLTSC